MILEKRSFVGDILCFPAVHSPLVTRTICSRAHLCGLCGSFCCGRLTAIGGLVGMAGPWSRWWGWVMRQLAVGSWGAPQLALIGRWAELGSGVGVGPGGPSTRVCLLVGRASP